MQFFAEKLQDVLAASNNYLLMRSFAISVLLLCLCVYYIFFFLFIELDIGLKKDALLSADGSSLEALLKGDSLEKRTTTDLRGSEEDSNQSDYTGVLNPAARIRKVPVVSIRSHENDLTFQLFASFSHCAIASS